MRVISKVVVQIGRDTNLNQKLFYVEESDATVTADKFTEQASGTFQLEPDGEKTLSLQDIQDARGLYVEADQDVVVTVNDTAIFQMRRPSTGVSAKARLFLEAVITSLKVEAPSGSRARGCFCLWGDLAIE